MQTGEYIGVSFGLLGNPVDFGYRILDGNGAVHSQNRCENNASCKGHRKFGFKFKSQIIKLCGFVLLSTVAAAILTHL